MADNEVTLEILVEASAAINRLNEFEKKSSESLGKVESSFGGIKTAAAAAITVFAGFELGKFLKSGIDSAIKQEQALAKLATQLEQTGENTDEAVKSFVDLGDELEKTTKFEDDAVIGAAALAKSFGLTNEQAITLTKAATELAAVTGDSLDTATRKLALTYSGTTGKLDEQIPAIKALTKAQLANGDAIGIVIERYGGAARREIETFAGSIGQTEKAFGNFAESIGTAIVQNPALIKSIQAIGTGFGELQKLVEDNRDVLDAAISGSVKAMAAAAPVIVDGIGLVVGGLEALIVVGADTLSGLEELAAAIGSLFQEPMQAADDLILGFAESVTKSVSEIPLISDALDSVGISLEDSAAAVANFREEHKTAWADAVAGTEELAAATAEFAVDATKRFDDFNAGFEGFAKGVEAISQGIFDADEKIIDSSKKVTAARGDIGRQAAKDSKEVEKLAAEAKKFLEGVSGDTVDPSEKITDKLFADLAKVREFHAQRVISLEEATAAEVKIRETAQQKLSKIEDEDNAKYAAQIKERLENFKQKVGDAAANPFKAVIGEVTVAPAALQGFESQIGGAVGTLSKILDGKTGAKNLITEGAGAFADSFIPGIGGAVTGVLGKLAEGPDAVKEFVKGFVDGIPDIIVAIAESAPVVVEALVDSLINEGGLIKIAAALLKAISGEALLKNIGKQLGINVGTALNADNIGKTMSEAFGKALPNFPELFHTAFEAGIEPLRLLFEGDIPGALKAAILGPFDVVRASLPEALKAPFDNFIAQVSGLGETMATGFTAALPDFSGIFTAAVGAAFEPIKLLFAGDISGALSAAITGPFDVVSASLPAALRAPFDEFTTRITTLVPQLGAQLGAAFKGSLPDFGALFASAANAFTAPIRALFAGDVSGAIKAAFTGPIDFFKNSLPGALRAPFDAFTTKLSSAFSGFNFPSLPKFSFPQLPTFKFPALPSFEFPELPTLTFPEPIWLYKLGIQTPSWLDKFTSAVEKLGNLGSIGGIGGGGGGSKGPVTGIPGSPFATGGKVPPGFPKDSFLSRLSSDERVLTPPQDRGLIKMLEDFAAGRLKTPSGGAGAGPIQVILQLGERQLASALVDLQRQGFRTA